MIRTTTLGLLFVVFMMLGMKAPSAQSCCTLGCSTSCVLMFMQPLPEDQLFDVEKKKPQHGRLRPDRPERGEPKSEWRKPFPSNASMPANMVEHIMAVASEIDPELAAQLLSMCEKDPEAFNKIIRKQGRRLGSLVHLRESDPELYEVKVTELSRRGDSWGESIRASDIGENCRVGRSCPSPYRDVGSCSKTLYSTVGATSLWTSGTTRRHFESV